MDLLKNRAVSATLFAIALGVTASHANAQQGKFNLPFEARWNNVVLQPGEYTISAPTAMSWPQIIRITGEKEVVRIFPVSEGVQAESNTSYLRIVTVGETRFIQEFDSGLTGKSFTFNVPKSNRNEAIVKGQARQTELAVLASR